MLLHYALHCRFLHLCIFHIALFLWRFLLCLGKDTILRTLYLSINCVHLPRYVMVKYADRGLAENGSVSPLFETLYLLVCVSLFSVFSIFAFYYILNQNPDKKSSFHLGCMGEPVDSSNFESMKSITLIFALTLPLLLILISMFCSIQYYLHSRGFSKKVPAIFGIYRRNVLSLKETFVFTITFFVLFYFHSFVLKFHNLFGLSSDMFRIYFLTNCLVINILIEGIILPLYILWNLHEKMPGLFSNQKVSELKFNFICNQNMEPRRLCESVKIKHVSMYLKKINQKYKPNLTSIIEMPEIV